MKISLFNKRVPYHPKNVKIDNITSLPGNSADELYRASDVIGNYAKAHKVNVRFFDARELMGEFDNPIVDRSLENSVGIEVSRRGKNTQGTWIKYSASDDKPFLRSVYESLQKIVEGKPLRIAEQKEETILKLIKQGKIKV